jgi:ATP-dependent helicase IRC3
MTIALRDYQTECLETVLSEFEAGINRQLITLPTGSGKTVVMAAIAKECNKRTLILAHREELISQTIEKFQLFWPGVNIGVCMAGRDEVDCQVVVGSVQSCCRPKRLERLKKQDFEVMMIDESHHAVSDSYQSVINALGFITGASDRLLIGVTATPHRADKQGLGETFEKITFSRSIGTMIRAGYLSPVTGRKILTSFVFEKIRSSNGDFSLEDLAEIVDTPERNAFIVEKFQEYASERKGVAFCCNVEHCKHLAEEFRIQGIAAYAVWGDMDSDDRRQVLSDLKSGKIQVAVSCGILIEGFDEPSVDVIVMTRPTKSAGLYIQCVGRGLRLWPGKQNCLVLDFSDRGHNLDSIMSLNSIIPEAIIAPEAKEEAEPLEEIDRQPKIEVLQEVDREFDILGSARFMWVPVGNEWSLSDDENREIIMSPSGEGFIGTLYEQDGSSRQIVHAALPLEYCAGVCEDYARRNLKVALSDLNSTWLNSSVAATSGQRTYLEKKKAWRSEMTKAEAVIEIRKIIAENNRQRRLRNAEPITDKQRFFLRRHGVETENMSKQKAMQAISALKKEQVTCA